MLNVIITPIAYIHSISKINFYQLFPSISYMLFKTAQRLFKRLILRKIIIKSNIISKRIEIFEGACVISSPSAWSFFSSHFNTTPSQLIQDHSLQVENVRNTAKTITEEVIIGVGGGRVLDITKAIAKIGKKKCILIPTILSTTAWLNPGASLKDDLKVHHAPGKFDEVLIDPELIAQAPEQLNIGGIADILCGYNSLSDWILAREGKGKELPRNAKGLTLGLCNSIKDNFESYLPITPASIEFIAHSFIEAMRLCWGLRSGRPVEGSEHFLYYALEETYNKPMNHGAIIALNTLVCIISRGESALIDPKTLENLYRDIGISYNLSDQKIPLEIYQKTIRNMKKFVRERNLDYSIWNTDLNLDKISDLKDLFS